MNADRKLGYRWSILLGVILSIHAGVLLHGLNRNFVVLDEVGHIPAGVSHWQLKGFSLYRVNPPLGRMLAALPVLAAGPSTDYRSLDDRPGQRSDWAVGRDFAEVNGPRYLQLVRLARLPGVLWSLGGALLIFRWARELYGLGGGLIGAVLWCFDPTVLAFAQVVTPDIPAAVAALVATYAFRRYLQTGTWWDAIVAGGLLGVAQLTKFSLILLYGVWPLLWLLQLLLRRADSAASSGRWRRSIGQLILMVVLSVDVINLGYFFDDTCRPLGNFKFVSQTLTGADSVEEEAHNRFQGTWLGSLPVPVPAEYVQGVDAQKKDFESHFPSYLHGEWRNRGWYHYYLYALAVKEPLGTWAIVIWAIALTLIHHKAVVRDAEEWMLLLPPLAILILVSSQDGFNHHMRYVLPMFPFLAVAAGKLAYFFHTGRRVWGALVVALLGWSVASSLAVVPHSMSYFNEVGGGPIRGHDYLVDSNIDWGQDLLALKDWLEEHPEARPLGLAYFHFLDPRPFLGVEYSVPPEYYPGETGGRPVGPGPRPGYYAISVNYLRGTTFNAPDGTGGWHYVADRSAFSYFRRLQPIARAGYSIYIYHITPAEAETLRRELGLSPLALEDQDARL